MSRTSAAHRFVISGGGPVGLATAVHLGRAGFGEQTVVVERDASYKHCSALLSAGGLRQQYSLRENILMSLYSSQFLQDYLKREQEETNDSANCRIAWKPNGYLFLAANQAQSAVLKRNNETQRSCGVDWIHMGDASTTLATRYPWLQTADLTAGSYSSGAQEGYLDPWGFMQCMKQEAVEEHGVLFMEGQVEYTKCKPTENSSIFHLESVHIRPGKCNTTSSSQTTSATIHELQGIEALINCTGAWTTEFVRNSICQPNADLLSPTQQEDILQLLPIERRKRCIFFIHCPGKQSTAPVPPPDTPLTIDPTGVYFRPEGNAPGNFLCGVSPVNDVASTDDEDLETVDHDLFEEIIWPTLAHRVPALEEVKVKSAWSGYYDYNALDQNAILGFHPLVSNLVCAGGFSGHGLQMAPAAGRAVTELLMMSKGKFQTLDLGQFSFERIRKQEPYLETGIV